MQNALKELLRSKRVVVLVASLIAGAAARKGLDLDVDSLQALMLGVVAYITGQSYVEASKPTDPPPPAA